MYRSCAGPVLHAALREAAGRLHRPLHLLPRDQASRPQPPTQQRWVLLSTLKGQCREMDIFWKFKHFNQFLLCMRWWFLRSFKGFSLLYTIINIIFVFLKLLINFENAYWNPPQNSLLCDWSILQCRPLIGCMENAQELTCRIFSVKIAALGSLKKVAKSAP